MGIHKRHQVRGGVAAWVFAVLLMPGVAIDVSAGVRSASTRGAGTWTRTGSLNTARSGHVATLLRNGQVLAGGGVGATGSDLASAELYDQAKGHWSLTGAMGAPRINQTQTLLGDGDVLAAGGYNNSNFALSSAELYNAGAGHWSPTGNMTTARAFCTATLLPNDHVLVAGGYQLQNNKVVVLSSAETYDPGTGAWKGTGTMTTSRVGHTATLLQDGKVLVAGGSADGSAELYDPGTGNWGATGSMSTPRFGHTATLLPNGEVLVVSGCSSGSAELYDPAKGAWSPAGSIATQSRFTAVLLGSGNTLVAGGHSGSYPNDFTTTAAELFEDAGNVLAATGSLNTARESHTATLLPSGDVIAAGGLSFLNGKRTTLASAELFNP